MNSPRIADPKYAQPDSPTPGTRTHVHLDALEPRPISLVSTGTANTPATTLYLSRGYTATGQVEIAPGITITQFRRDQRLS